MTTAKLNHYEREDAKSCIRECILSKFTRDESLAYVRQRMRRDDITIYDIDRLKYALRNDTKKWMNSLMKDRWAYVAQYKERLDEYLKYQKEYWRIFYSNPDNGFLRKTCLDSLQNTSNAITQLYDIMPEIAGGQFENVKDLISKTTEETAGETTTTTKKPIAWTA